MVKCYYNQPIPGTSDMYSCPFAASHFVTWKDDLVFLLCAPHAQDCHDLDPDPGGCVAGFVIWGDYAYYLSHLGQLLRSPLCGNTIVFDLIETVKSRDHRGVWKQLIGLPVINQSSTKARAA